MKITLKPLDQQVIVITGASSGIGLATAYAAAKEGAKLVLAARSEADLDRITQEINSKGGEAIFVVADVGSKQDVEKIAQAAKTYYGGFDTWVNDAGVSIYGRLQEVSDEDNGVFSIPISGVWYMDRSLLRANWKRAAAPSSTSVASFPILRSRYRACTARANMP